MGYSQKLDGFWEEGYHFYVEIRDEKITIRDYRRKVMTETELSYDAESVERGVRTEIVLANRNLSTNCDGEPMSWFEDMYFEDGQIHATECYSFMDRRDPYVLKKVDHGPFDHIVIRDEEYLERLQGVWKDCKSPDKEYLDLVIRDDTVQMMGEPQRFHVVSYTDTGSPEDVYIVPYDLTQSDFGGFTRIQVKPDTLTTRMLVCDMSVPLSVYARADMVDKITLPREAEQPAVSVMTPGPMTSGPMMGFMGLVQETAARARTNFRFCPECGEKLATDGKVPKFCSNCGTKLNADM